MSNPDTGQGDPQLAAILGSLQQSITAQVQLAANLSSMQQSVTAISQLVASLSLLQKSIADLSQGHRDLSQELQQHQQAISQKLQQHQLVEHNIQDVEQRDLNLVCRPPLSCREVHSERDAYFLIGSSCVSPPRFRPEIVSP